MTASFHYVTKAKEEMHTFQEGFHFLFAPISLNLGSLHQIIKKRLFSFLSPCVLTSTWYLILLIRLFTGLTLFLKTLISFNPNMIYGHHKACFQSNCSCCFPLAFVDYPLPFIFPWEDVSVNFQPEQYLFSILSQMYSNERRGVAGLHRGSCIAHIPS